MSPPPLLGPCRLTQPIHSCCSTSFVRVTSACIREMNSLPRELRASTFRKIGERLVTFKSISVSVGTSSRLTGLGGETYLTLNDFISNTQPRIGFSWDFLGEGNSKLFANYARFLETPIPLDINVRAGSERDSERL